MSHAERATHVQKAIVAIRKGFAIKSTMRPHSRGIVAWCKCAQKDAKPGSAAHADLSYLRATAETLVETFAEHPSTTLVANPGSPPAYKSDAVLLERHAGGPYIKERKHPLKRGHYFRLKTPKAATEAELVLVLREAVATRPAGFGAREQFRLCADVMLEKGLTGAEGFQFLAHAVDALRTRPRLVPLDDDKVLALFKQCRGMLATGAFGASSEAAALWLFELGQLMAHGCPEWGNLKPM
jgi:hypothetical protein